ncbi:MAG: hypothetical protein KGH88_06565 [Thaumarchaeota archaeon]|nr:hypothetical protein [Nitrososphaerota archaeon]
MRKPTKSRQPKEKTDSNLWSEEEKVARLYKAGKLKGKTYQSLKDLRKDLYS